VKAVKRTFMAADDDSGQIGLSEASPDAQLARRCSGVA
jgi:hypothetical protein